MRITTASLMLGLVLMAPAAPLAQNAGPALPRADTKDMYFAYVPPRAEKSAFVPPKAEVTGSIPAPATQKPPVDRGLPNQKVGRPKGLYVVRDICVGCMP
ncbi:hypothetical protein [Methylobacterium sp. ID0610]|uniref:hypothetical protein n=1 Tax=Methylobacterium carpenticola TaxID=3344827 RepID=UPI00367E9DBC